MISPQFFHHHNSRISIVSKNCPMHNRHEIAHLLDQAIKQVLGDKGITAKITPDSPIDSTLGLDSLDWAAVAVHMEDQTGLDPFSEGFIGKLATVNDLIDLYVQTASNHPPIQ